MEVDTQVVGYLVEEAASHGNVEDTLEHEVCVWEKSFSGQSHFRHGLRTDFDQIRKEIAPTTSNSGESTYPIVALWAHPRSCSTAMERIFMERKDFTIFHEPFSVLYYAHEAESQGRPSCVFEDDVGNLPNSYEDIKKQILEAAKKSPVFFKDMSYHAFQHIAKDENFLTRLTNTFIIRDPAKAISSHYAMNPYVTKEELGYSLQLEMFQIVADLSQRKNSTTVSPIIVDAADLIKRPAETLKTYCGALFLDYLPEALHWNPGQPKEWKIWASWHKDASRSTGIFSPTKMAQISKYTVTVENNEILRSMYEAELPFYQILHSRRLRVS